MPQLTMLPRFLRDAGQNRKSPGKSVPRRSAYEDRLGQNLQSNERTGNEHTRWVIKNAKRSDGISQVSACRCDKNVSIDERANFLIHQTGRHAEDALPPSILRNQVLKRHPRARLLGAPPTSVPVRFAVCIVPTKPAIGCAHFLRPWVYQKVSEF